MIITDRYSKQKRAVFTSRITAITVVWIFFAAWVAPYGIPSHVFTDNETQFLSQLLDTLCTHLYTKHMKTSAYRPQTNRKAFRYSKTIVTRLRHYLPTHQQDWDLFVQPLKFAWNTKVHRPTNTTPFSLFFAKHSPRSTTFDSHSAPCNWCLPCDRRTGSKNEIACMQ